MASIKECRVIKLPTVLDDRGIATFVADKDIPFNIRRVYYLYHVPRGKSRGAHAHTKEKQVVVAVSGCFDVLLDDGRRRKRVRLDSPSKGLYIPPMIWREFHNFSKDGVLLAIVDDLLDKEEYIRDYENFKRVTLRNRKR
jgi:dTDP-4-dehydrorhamnose 3,5-epimerase-like enzyme